MLHGFAAMLLDDRCANGADHQRQHRAALRSCLLDHHVVICQATATATVLLRDVNTQKTRLRQGIPQLNGLCFPFDDLLKIPASEAAHQFANAVPQQRVVLCRVDERRTENTGHQITLFN